MVPRHLRFSSRPPPLQFSPTKPSTHLISFFDSPSEHSAPIILSNRRPSICVCPGNGSEREKAERYGHKMDGGGGGQV